MPEEYHVAFTAWLMRLREQDVLDFDPFQGWPAVGEWLYGLYRANGELPIQYLGPEVAARRETLARAAVAVLSEAVAADGHPVPGFAVSVVDAVDFPEIPCGIVTVEGARVLSVDPQGVLAEAAEGVQEYLADPGRIVWPSCPEHGRGVHPAVERSTGTAVWRCSAGHVVRPIRADFGE